MGKIFSKNTAFFKECSILNAPKAEVNINSYFTENNVTIIKTILLKLLREIIAVYCENLLKHINILCGQSAAFNLKSYGSYNDHFPKCSVTALHAKPVFSCTLKLLTHNVKTFVSCFILIKWPLLYFKFMVPCIMIQC